MNYRVTKLIKELYEPLSFSVNLRVTYFFAHNKIAYQS
jgi:hypothetical protein